MRGRLALILPSEPARSLLLRTALRVPLLLALRAILLHRVGQADLFRIPVLQTLRRGPARYPRVAALARVSVRQRVGVVLRRLVERDEGVAATLHHRGEIVEAV